jgi:hypothetical protein
MKKGITAQGLNGTMIKKDRAKGRMGEGENGRLRDSET